MITALRCPCNKSLTDHELNCFDEFGGMCEECYTIAMHTCYTDDFEERLKTL